MNKTSRYLFKGILEADTPFMIGNGEDTYSDKDLLRNPDGIPYIPGTTLAGVCRAYMEDIFEDIEKWFGSRKMKKESARDIESSIIFYDAQLDSSDKHYTTRIRDSVKLKNKIASPKGKFDFEIVEAGAKFLFRLEFRVNDEEEKVISFLKMLIEGFNSGEIRIGGKTSRGYGYFKLTDPKGQYFDLTESEDLDKYIKLDWKNNPSSPFVIGNTISYSNLSSWQVTLHLNNFLFIRDYALSKDDNKNKISAKPLKDGSGRVVIPGTTWAGVFRHHMNRILEKVNIEDTYRDREKFLNTLFGYAKEDGSSEKQASKLFFKESVFEADAVSEILRTRTAIDRFTGGASEGLLFSNKLAYTKGDESICTLDIALAKDFPFDEFDKVVNREFVESLIEVCIDELTTGYLAVGGQTAIGGGIFKKEEVKLTQFKEIKSKLEKIEDLENLENLSQLVVKGYDYVVCYWSDGVRIEKASTYVVKEENSDGGILQELRAFSEHAELSIIRLADGKYKGRIRKDTGETADSVLVYDESHKVWGNVQKNKGREKILLTEERGIKVELPLSDEEVVFVKVRNYFRKDQGDLQSDDWRFVAFKQCEARPYQLDEEARE